ncbi:MAG: fused MFS/spermidine synthase [Candidatus Wallbacteria bacterium]|nr:fused MFS/spermidine synthase [Candidatus Wallbacteria bacterium]
MKNNSIKNSLYLIFFASGFTALIYQVVWNRYLSRILGSTTYASATTVSTFMLGLAGGSLLAGKLSSNLRKPLKSYAFLELSLGVYAIFFPYLMMGMDRIYFQAYPMFSNGPGSLLFLRFSLSVVSLILPALVMGATLPLASSFLNRFTSSFDSDLARLYGINTAGAAIGGLLAGFILIPGLGMKKNLFAAAALNFIIAWLALRLSETGHGREKSREQLSGKQKVMDEPVIPFVLFFTGFAFMILEIAIIRALSLCFGSSVYAFSLTISIFIFSLAWGSWRAKRLIELNENIYPVLLPMVFMAGLAILLSVVLVMSIPGLVVLLFSYFLKADYHLFLGWQAFLSFIALFLPALFAGHIFPLSAAVYSRKQADPAGTVGMLYAVNTAGDVLGTLCAGFIFLPVLGMQNSLYLAAFLFFLCATVIAKRAERLYRFIPFLIIPLLVVYLIPKWDYSFFNSAVFYRPGRYVKKILAEKKSHASGRGITVSHSTEASAPNILFQKEGIEAFINVLEDKGIRTLAINGKVDASDGADMSTQRLLGHVPCFLHPDPQKVLVIGWGSGVTAWCASLHGPSRIDAVEICSEVVDASRFFSHVNGNILESPGLNMHIDDGRNFLYASRDRFDVIISEPTNLWIAGIGSLFSIEFFDLVKSRLNPGGIICQWVHCYEISEQDFKTVIRTFSSVFPFCHAFKVGESDLLLTGGFSGISSMDWMKDRISSPAGQDMQKDGISSIEDFLALELASGNDLRIYAGDGELNTDDNSLIEFSAPYSLFIDNQKLIQKLEKSKRNDPPLLQIFTQNKN